MTGNGDQKTGSTTQDLSEESLDMEPVDLSAAAVDKITRLIPKPEQELSRGEIFFIGQTATLGSRCIFRLLELGADLASLNDPNNDELSSSVIRLYDRAYTIQEIDPTQFTLSQPVESEDFLKGDRMAWLRFMASASARMYIGHNLALRSPVENYATDVMIVFGALIKSNPGLSDDKVIQGSLNNIRQHLEELS